MLWKPVAPETPKPLQRRHRHVLSPYYVPVNILGFTQSRVLPRAGDRTPRETGTA